MYFKQLVKEDLGCASYIVGCPNAAVCAVIDPRLDMVDEILEFADKKEMKIAAVIETHNHADHISGHGEIARRTGADIYVHEEAHAEYPHKNLKDEDELQFGIVKVRVMHTPGHRPEHIALAVADTSRGEDPWLVLTGDSLFIGDVARPDLAVPGEEGASVLYDSIFDRLLRLDDGVEVYPAHVAGSLCGRGMNAKTSSTIGFERKYNPAVAPRSREAFVQDMNENLPQRPPNMYNIVERNRQDYAHSETPLVARPLDTLAFRREMENGALVIDVRSPHQFAAGHIPGVMHVALRGSAFPTRVGFVASPESRLLLVVKDERDLRDAMTQFAVVGYDEVIGYLDGGMMAWQEADLPMQTLNQVTVEQLHEMLPDLPVLDVRDQGEWDEGHIEGALHVPYYFIEQQLQEGQEHNVLDAYQDEPLAVICGSGQRSTIASAILQKHGFARLINVMGGMDEWNRNGFSISHTGQKLLPPVR
ncbi:MAG TPA: MBL fold metallo-hydrolase [Ktedonobacteraceae bacterium]|nr:MBL fold metallo-hydrolase [Ktedonobacteraceae bacterium]